MCVLLQVLTLFAKHKTHRIYVVNDEFKPVSVITCTDILSIAMNS